MYDTSGYTGYGLATFNLTRRTGQHGAGGVAMGHLGATCGYQSVVAYNPAMDFSIAVATNIERDEQDQPPCRRLFERIAKRRFAKRSNRTANKTSQQREEKRKGLCLLPCAPPTGYAYFPAAFKPAIKGTLSGAKLNSLTPLGSVVLPLLKITCVLTLPPSGRWGRPLLLSVPRYLHPHYHGHLHPRYLHPRYHGLHHFHCLSQLKHPQHLVFEGMCHRFLCCASLPPALERLIYACVVQ
jgi:hypothetical protein